MITNSHLYGYYPIPELATGGAIGNSIFFCFSGFGIYLSQIKMNRPFSEWIVARISRIYPTIWLVLIFISWPILLYSGKFDNDYVLTFIGHFLNPPQWFIRVLIVYYILSFVFLKPDKKRMILSVLTGLFFLYFVIYYSLIDLSLWQVEDHPIKIIHYFMIFLFGIYLASRNEGIEYTGKHNYFVILSIFVITYWHKYLMSKGQFFEFQWIQQAAMYPLIYYSLKVSRTPFLLSMLRKPNIISSIVRFLSDHTLELYIIQETILYSILKIGLPFPFNMMTFIFFTFLLSTFVNRWAGTIRAAIS